MVKDTQTNRDEGGRAGRAGGMILSVSEVMPVYCRCL